MGRLSGKVALVTGAARGQGRSHALRLARDGADLALIDIADRVSEVVLQPPATRADFDETVKMVEGEGRRVVSAVGDVAVTLPGPLPESVSKAARTSAARPVNHSSALSSAKRPAAAKLSVDPFLDSLSDGNDESARMRSQSCS